VVNSDWERKRGKMPLLITKNNNHGEDEVQGMEVGNFNVQM
jgi:hypothetical protein